MCRAKSRKYKSSEHGKFMMRQHYNKNVGKQVEKLQSKLKIEIPEGFIKCDRCRKPKEEDKFKGKTKILKTCIDCRNKRQKKKWYEVTERTLRNRIFRLFKPIDNQLYEIFKLYKINVLIPKYRNQM
jgi:hypothetical protein